MSPAKNHAQPHPAFRDPASALAGRTLYVVLELVEGGELFNVIAENVSKQLGRVTVLQWSSGFVVFVGRHFCRRNERGRLCDALPIRSNTFTRRASYTGM